MILCFFNLLSSNIQFSCRRLNGGDEFHVRFENNETKAVIFADVTDSDDGSYAVKFCTKVMSLLN